MKLRGINGTISVEEYFNREVENFKENFVGENSEAVENFKGWIDGDSDFVAVHDNGDRIENELSAEDDEYYYNCYNAAIEEIKKYFRV